MSESPDPGAAGSLNTLALVGFFASGFVGAMTLFTLPLFVDTSTVLSLDTFRGPFIIVCLVEGAAALGVIYFGLNLYTPGPEVEAAADGGRRRE